MKQTNFGASARRFVMGFVMMLGFMFVAGSVSAQAFNDKADLTPINYKKAAVAQYDLEATLAQLKAYLQTNPSLTPQEQTEYAIKSNYWRSANLSLGNGENVKKADENGIQQVFDIVNQMATIDPASLTGVNVEGTLEAARAVVKN